MHSVFTNYTKEELAAIEQQSELGVAYSADANPVNHTPFTTIGYANLWNTNIMTQKGTLALFCLEKSLLVRCIISPTISLSLQIKLGKFK